MRLHPHGRPHKSVFIFRSIRYVYTSKAVAEVVVLVMLVVRALCGQNQILTDLDIHEIKSARGDAGIYNTQPAPSPWSMAVSEPYQQGSSFNA